MFKATIKVEVQDYSGIEKALKKAAEDFIQYKMELISGLKLSHQSDDKKISYSLIIRVDGD